MQFLTTTINQNTKRERGQGINKTLTTITICYCFDIECMLLLILFFINSVQFSWPPAHSRLPNYYAYLEKWKTIGWSPHIILLSSKQSNLLKKCGHHMYWDIQATFKSGGYHLNKVNKSYIFTILFQDLSQLETNALLYVHAKHMPQAAICKIFLWCYKHF